jgi:hypothetical protein
MDTGNMAGNDVVQDVFQLDLKINGLVAWAKGNGDSKLYSLRALEKSEVIAYSTLQSAMKAQRMSVGDQKALAAAFGFDIEWREWRDPDPKRAAALHQRCDKAEAFLEKFYARPRSGVFLTVDAGSTTTRVDYRVADYSFAVAGSFDPSVRTAEIPLVLSLSFDERGWSLVYDATILTVGLKSVDLELFPMRDRAPIGDVSVKLSELTHTVAEGNFRGIVRGLHERPWWIISNPNGECISGVRRRNDGRDCTCKGFRSGDEIQTRMTTRVSDCVVSVSGQAFESASEAQKKFIEHLAALEVLKGAEVILAEQTLKLVEQHEQD